MAKNKIERIDQEIAKTREKIAEQQEKLKALEAQKTEAENLEIVQMVRALRMTPAQLNALLSGGMVPGQMAVPASVFCASRAFSFSCCSAIFSRVLAISWSMRSILFLAIITHSFLKKLCYQFIRP